MSAENSASKKKKKPQQMKDVPHSVSPNFLDFDLFVQY